MNSMYMLDTNVVIAFFKGEKATSQTVLNRLNQIALSSLVIAELDYGAKASQKYDDNLEKLYSFIELVKVLPFNIDCARILGTVKTNLRKKGKPTGEVDALIAATAINFKATLVTKNIKHFKNIEGLAIEIW